MKDFEFRLDYKHGHDEKVPSVRELGPMSVQLYCQKGHAMRQIMSMYLRKKGKKIVDA